MKKLISLTIILFVVFIAYRSFTTPSVVEPAPSAMASAAPTPIGRMIISYDGVDGQSALDLLKSSHDVLTQSSSYGEYVDAIDGIAGGTEGRYWILYVDSSMATIGADKLMTKSNQKIEWKFETQEENGTK